MFDFSRVQKISNNWTVLSDMYYRSTSVMNKTFVSMLGALGYDREINYVKRNEK